jgi:hypothetical protein
MTEEFRAAVVFMCAAVPNPVVEFSSLATVKSRQGLFLPAVMAKSILPGNRETTTKFPIFCMDAASEANFDELRKALHARLDASFDDYKAAWNKAVKEKANAPKKELKSVKDLPHAAKEEPSAEKPTE